MTWKRARPHLLTEKEASGRIREIFDEIKQALGVPYVNMLFEALASYPAFLVLFWATAKPALHTQEPFIYSERLGAEAYTRMHNYFAVPPLRSNGTAANHVTEAQAELQEAVELYHYNYSVLVLLVAALVYAFEHPGTRIREGTPVAIDSRYLKQPVLVEEDAATLASSLPKPLQLSSSQMEEAGVSAHDIDSVIQLAESFLNLTSKQALNIS